MPGWGCRTWLERYRPGGWWRRDTVLRALWLAWPHWLDGRQVYEMCQHLHPKWGRTRDAASNTHRTLKRLVERNLAERRGKNHYGFMGRMPGNDWKTGWIKAPLAEYRLLVRTEDLL